MRMVRAMLARVLPFAILLASACATGSDSGGIIPGADATPAEEADATPASPCEAEPCFEMVSCTDTAEGYTCGDCPSGLEGNGELCGEIDGCADMPCYSGVACTDVAAPDDGATCGECPGGLFGNGMICTDIDGCEGAPCFPGAACTDTPAPEVGFTCSDCPAGYEGDGLSCTDVDGCAASPCFSDVTCTDAVAPLTGFSCGACPAGHAGDGQTCTLLCDPVGAVSCGTPIAASNNGAGSSDRIDTWECSALSHTGPEIIYTFVPAGSGIATVHLTGLSADLDLMVIKDSAMAGLCDSADAGICVPGGNSNLAGSASEKIRFDALAGETYYIIVDGYSGATSSFTLLVESAIEDFLLHEVSYGEDDFVEVRNHGACTADFDGLSLLHKASLGSAPQTITFASTMVAPGAVLRWIESASGPYLPNEIDAGESILDIPADAGSTALCNGACDTTDCDNLLDYLERDDDTGDTTTPGGPACASMVGGPIDSAGQSGNVSLRRAAFDGVGGPYESTDWAFGPTTRD